MSTRQMIYPEKMGCQLPAVAVRDISGARLQPEIIRAYVMLAVDYARRRPNANFEVQADGWGYDRKVIAPMFDHCPDNIRLPYGFIY